MSSVETAIDTDKHAVILFDGMCNLCNGTVNFIIDHDPTGYFRFAPLQSEIADTYLGDLPHTDRELGTIVLVEQGHTYVRSTAALRIARRLTGAWSLLSLALVIPRPIRDAVYNWIATNRYEWFGQRDQCRMPTPDLKARFLDYDAPQT